MKKRILFIISIIFLVVIFISAISMCEKKTYYWDFEYEADDIKEIKIIEILDSDREFSVIKEIDMECLDELISDIKSLEYKRYGTNLSHPFDKCFLIVFEDGNYDIISKIEPKHYRYNYGKYKYYEYDELVPYNSWLKCRDYNQFDALINKYLEE